MIFLIVETYHLNCSNPTIALDKYFGPSQSDLKDWLKRLKYSAYMSYKDFNNYGFDEIDKYLKDPVNLKIHLVSVGSNSVNNDFINRNKLNKDKNKVIIYPFDKFNILKNEFIREILAKQLSL